MDYNQAFEIIKYLFEGINIPKAFFLYAGIGIGFLIVLRIIIKLIKKRSTPKEIIEQQKCFKFNHYPSKIEINSLLTSLYKEIYLHFKDKYHLGMEIINNHGRIEFFLILPLKVNKKINFQVPEYLTLCQNKEREKYLENENNPQYMYRLETSKDFFYPLKGINLINFNYGLNKDELIFIQILLRPARHQWIKSLKKYIENLKKGKDMIPADNFLYGCSSVVLPFLSNIADFITFIVFGKGKKKENVINKEKINFLELKLADFGFESQITGFVRSDDEDRIFQFFETMIDVGDIDNINNKFIYSDKPKKTNNNDSLRFKYLYFSKENIDILNLKEINNIIN